MTNTTRSLQISQVAIIETDVFGALAYHAECLDCPWKSKRYDRKATAVKHAKAHGEAHTQEAS